MPERLTLNLQWPIVQRVHYATPRGNKEFQLDIHTCSTSALTRRIDEQIAPYRSPPPACLRDCKVVFQNGEPAIHLNFDSKRTRKQFFSRLIPLNIPWANIRTYEEAPSQMKIKHLNWATLSKLQQLVKQHFPQTRIHRHWT